MALPSRQRSSHPINHNEQTHTTMSKPEYDVLRIEGSSNRVEVLMKNCDRETADDLSSCVADHPGYIWAITEAGQYRYGDLYPSTTTLNEGRAE